MTSYMHHSWTVCGLVTAFLELGLAYFLLCGSAIVFVASKFLLAVGLCVPCPCSGIFGYRNGDLCLHRMLVDWPLRKIYVIQNLAWSSLPFDLVWFRDPGGDSNLVMLRDKKCENGETDLYSGSGSGSRLRSLDDKEHGFNPKGKRVGNQKHKTVISKRNRRATAGYGKSILVLPSSSSVQSASAGVSSSHSAHREMRSEIHENLHPVNENENGLPDDKIASVGTDFYEETWRRVNGPYRTIEETNCGLLPNKSSVSNDQNGLEEVENESDAITILKQALQEEKAVRAALYMELENERAAAATAADEAIAMILKLQAEKASLQMEAKQYERMMEEKFAYDEEEMNILTEILVKRERENHLLEKELEAYKHVNELDSESFRGDPPEDLSLISMNSCKRITEQALAQKLAGNLDSVDFTVDKAVYDVHVVEDKTEPKDTGPLKDADKFLE